MIKRMWQTNRFCYRFLAGVFIMLAMGCSPKAEQLKLRPQDKRAAQEQVIEAQNALADEFKSPHVTLFCLDGRAYVLPSEKKASKETRPMLRGFPIILEREGTAEEFSEVQTLLTDSKTYGGNVANCFWPGFGMHLEEGHRSLLVLICGHCHVVYIYPKNKIAHDRETKEYGEGKFELPLCDAGNQSFLTLYGKLFPEATNSP